MPDPEQPALNDLLEAVTAHLPPDWEVSAHVLDPAWHRVPAVAVRLPDGRRHAIAIRARPGAAQTTAVLADAMAARLLAWSQRQSPPDA